MTSKILQELLKSTAFLGVLLLIGLYLRAKISLFRRFLVPASVIGGFLGLLLGPEVLGLTGYSPISPEWNKTWSLLAGILVVPMFAGIPLGNFVKKKRLDPQENRKEAAKIAIVSGIASGAFGFQIILGVGLPLLFMAFIPGLEFYNQFGYEIKSVRALTAVTVWPGPLGACSWKEAPATGNCPKAFLPPLPRLACLAGSC